MLFTSLYFLPAPQARKAREFFTQLVAPEALPPWPAKPRSTPPNSTPVPLVSRSPGPLPPVAGPQPETMPSPDSPVLLEEGREDSKPLPEGASSSPGLLKSGKPADKRESTVREKLFDRDIIGHTALKGEGGKKKNDILSFDSQDYRYAGYMRRLKEKIESIWEYPPEAAKKGLYGDLKISFTIKKDGKLGAVELARTSGYRMLDEAALKALRDGEPYWPIPDAWGMESYTITGHFFYTMYGYGIR